MKNYDNTSGEAILRAAYDAWNACAPLRSSRERNKRFTYGDQWSDVTLDRHGRAVTDYQRYCLGNDTPITNNLLRQLVKTVVGRFRAQYLHPATQDADGGSVLGADTAVSDIDELDARALEEFLISGCCVQRIDYRADGLERRPQVSNVDLNNFFVNRFRDPLGRDIELIGQIHQLPVAELLQRTADGDRRRAAWIRRLYTESPDARTAAFTAAIGADTAAASAFWYSATDKCRAIEVWTLESRETLVCHNKRTATVTYEPLARGRQLRNDPDVDLRWDIVTQWHCRWFTPMGDLLCHRQSPYHHGAHPYAVRFYPLTDGEVHAFIEDVIDQQKYVNRLITLIDHIMQASAKGVLLFPDTSLPDGFSWDDIRSIWSNSNGILPYSPLAGVDQPKQISHNNTDIGAFDMIQLQMKLLEEISGVSGALQGKNINTGGSVNLYRNEVINAAIALTDVFDTFNAWRGHRDTLLRQLCRQSGN